MKKAVATTFVGLLTLSACAPKPQAPAASQSLANPQTSTWQEPKTQPPANASKVAPAPASPDAPAPLPGGNDVAAVVNGAAITYDQLQRPVIEAYGLQFLLHLAQLELARQKVREAGLVVTPADIAAERHRTLGTWFKGTVDETLDKLEQDGKPDRPRTDEEKEKFRAQEYERMLAPFLESQRITQQEFELAIQTNAHLYKLAQSKVSDKFDDKVLDEAFRIKYGEKVQVRHIQCANLREASAARQRLDAGEPFEKVALDVSRDDKSRQFGGLIRPFSRAERWWPQAFKDAAFALKNPGDLSDIVQVDTGDHRHTTYHIIRLEQKLPPNKAVKFEDHKDILRQELYNLALSAQITRLRQELLVEARRAMDIKDPVLRKQYVQRNDRASGGNVRDPQELRRQLELERPSPPATQPATPPASPTDGRTEVARPPATRPGA